jgi:hypothetical protein
MVVSQEPAAPERLARDQRARVRAAAFAAPRRYPGPVGECLARELFTWEEFGYRFGDGKLIARLVDHLLEPRPST